MWLWVEVVALGPVRPIPMQAMLRSWSGVLAKVLLSRPAIRVFHGSGAGADGPETIPRTAVFFVWPPGGRRRPLPLRKVGPRQKKTSMCTCEQHATESSCDLE